MSSTEFKGTYTALATPFNNDGVDYDDLEALVEYQIKGGITGLVAVGTTGESPTLSHSEHIDVIRQTVQFANTRVPVYAGTGSNSTENSMEFSLFSIEPEIMVSESYLAHLVEYSVSWYNNFAIPIHCFSKPVCIT